MLSSGHVLCSFALGIMLSTSIDSWYGYHEHMPIRLTESFSLHLFRLGPFGLLVDFESYMTVWGSRSGLIEWVAPCRFSFLDSQPDSLNMGAVPRDFHEFRLLGKSCLFMNFHFFSRISWISASGLAIYHVFGPSGPAVYRVFLCQAMHMWHDAINAWGVLLAKWAFTC